jgi:hypothetical protein
MYDILQLLKNNELINIIDRYEKERTKEDYLDINIFELVSDIYHRENMHSDIIAFFLNAEKKHNHGNKYFKLFLEYLDKIAPRLKIKFEDFTEYSIQREDKRIDILIKGQNDKCIIIENKINNAADTNRQLPTYVEAVGKKNVCAILYLSLDGYKPIDTRNWNEDEIQFIDKLRIDVSAFNNKESDIVTGWLNKCLAITKENSDTYFCLNQYANLIKLIKGKIMETKELKEFYDIIVLDKNYQTALSIKTMIDGLKVLRVEKIVEKFTKQTNPFDKVYPHNNSSAVFGHWNTMKLVLQIYPLDDCYRFEFWDRDYSDKKSKENLAEISVQKLNYSDVLKNDGSGTMIAKFKFPSEEEKMYEFIIEFKNKLGTLATSKNKREI